ncbi:MULTISPECIES: DUF3014 domain-containing protein [unclassified Pseudoalteromonas]|uniref:DUF3014 domain-containing protein n=1 Tax=unclassified Pseudoalteromonas TaxID=194690 RepID=UPI0025B5BCBF|nr:MULTISPECIES: DUF3014 domain-containing protein [unclassified Pseudoalteromonas]MDN3377966.1 DUF3014 domain-containing protein [Pseudoalteromonas sp. APC 3893]MDN3386732.1 DUF3014 domain-containing protein [Pseudoalteromonas sp. APC 4017]
MSDQSPQPDVEKRPPNNNLLFALVILIVIACAAAFVLLSSDEEPQPVVEQAPVEQPIQEYKAPEPKETEPEPEVLPEPEVVERPPSRDAEPALEVKSLPNLNESDEVVVANIDEYLSDQVMGLLVTDDVIRRGVVFIDNLAKGKVAAKHAPVERPEESFSVIEGEILTIDPNSYERYTPYVKIFTSMSAAQIVRLYEEYKPLINDAYTEIGYQGDAFNQTLEEAIELLLDTPEPKGDMPLLRDSVTYQYAYSEWERLPAAQKQLLRMGLENMKKVKAVLRNVQAELDKQQ